MAGFLSDHSATARVTIGYRRNWFRADVGNVKACGVLQASACFPRLMQAPLRDGGRGLARFCSIQERLEIYFEGSPAVLRQTGKAEGLQPSLRRPHRKERLGLLPDGSAPKVKHEIHGDFLVEGTL